MLFSGADVAGGLHFCPREAKKQQHRRGRPTKGEEGKEAELGGPWMPLHACNACTRREGYRILGSRSAWTL